MFLIRQEFNRTSTSTDNKTVGKGRLKIFGIGVSVLAGVLARSALGEERIILPGDLLSISSEQNGELCVRRVVNPDGKVLLPEIGPIGVATLTPSQVEEKIRRMLLDAGLANERVHVVTRFMKGEPISVGGAVAHPIRLRFRRGIYLDDLLSTSSPSDFADLSRVSVSHADGTSAIASGKDHILLTDGDRVVVRVASGPRSIEVVGGVNRPSQIDFRLGFTLGAAIGEAGGISARGVGSRITIQRQGELIPISLPDDENLELKPGDQVRVEVVQSVQHVVVSGLVVRQGLVDLGPGMTLSQAIAQSGGVQSPNQDLVVSLKRKGEHGYLKPMKFSYRDLVLKKSSDPLLSLNDVIEVTPSDLKSKR